MFTKIKSINSPHGFIYCLQSHALTQRDNNRRIASLRVYKSISFLPSN